MSLGELGRIDVSSVSKTSEPLADAPAAIFVITHDMIVGSGATTIPEILRLAPNLEVYQQSASQYVVTARGMNGNAQAQAFSNKLLVLIDGRSVYTPLYSGVYWDTQDVLPEDIDRIEVISGPGATLWGANAVNGVINIITRKASQTQGFYGDVQAGAQERAAGLRYGGLLGPSLAYRLYVHANDGDATQTVTGASAGDDWQRLQGGFRLDWTPQERDAVTVQGDLYGGRHRQSGAPNETISGGNLVTRWTHDAGNSDFQVQAYFDAAARRTDAGGGHFWVNTADFDAQDTLHIGNRDTLVLGADLRASWYRIYGAGGLAFLPAQRTLWLGSGFAQNTFAITGKLDLVTGLKLEDDPYAGTSLLPDVRLSWRPVHGAMIWGAVSRAVRSPTPFDVDVQEYLGNLLYLQGNPDFRTEKLTAFELGTRIAPSDKLSISLSGYYNRYDDLRSIEFSPTVLPLTWGNELRGNSYGIELWGDWRPLRWWTLSAGLDMLDENFAFAPGASQLLGTAQLGSDPRSQAMLRSSVTTGPITISGELRHVGALPAPYAPAYTELEGRIGWALGRHVELSLTGENLLHDAHQEYPGGAFIPRQIRAGLRWRF
jgi:iron complex outermembrane receptor protein